MEPGSETVRAMSPITFTDIYIYIPEKERKTLRLSNQKVGEGQRVDPDQKWTLTVALRQKLKAFSRKLLSHPLPLRKLQA